MWHYRSTLTWRSGKQGDLVGEQKLTVPVGTPVEFGGPAGVWTPEDLLAASVGACLMTTALHFLDRSEVGLRSYVVEADGILEKTSQGLALTGIAVDISATVGNDDEAGKAARALERAESSCLVSRTLRIPVSVNAHVHVADGT